MNQPLLQLTVIFFRIIFQRPRNFDFLILLDRLCLLSLRSWFGDWNAPGAKLWDFGVLLHLHILFILILVPPSHMMIHESAFLDHDVSDSPSVNLPFIISLVLVGLE